MAAACGTYGGCRHPWLINQRARGYSRPAAWSDAPTRHLAAPEPAFGSYASSGLPQSYLRATVGLTSGLKWDLPQGYRGPYLRATVGPTSERAWRLWAARHSQRERGRGPPLDVQPLPRVLEPATFRVAAADIAAAAFDCPGPAYHSKQDPPCSLLRAPYWQRHRSPTLASWGGLYSPLAALRTRDAPPRRPGPSGEGGRRCGRGARPTSP